MHPDPCRWHSKWLTGVRDILQRVCGRWTGGQSTVITRCLTQEQDSNSNCGLAREEGKDRVLDPLKLWHSFPILFSFAHLYWEKLNTHFLRLPCNCRVSGHVTQFWSMRCNESFMGASEKTPPFLTKGTEKTGASPPFSLVFLS